MIEMGMPMILECEQRKLITKMGVPTMLLELKETKCKPMIENGISNDDIETKIKTEMISNSKQNMVAENG